MIQKEKIEININQLHSELKEVNAFGESMVDSEGFPRGDLDINQVVLKRKKYNSLQVDHQEVMKRIEELIYEVHSEPVEPSAPIPFAKVDQVFEGSPAEKAGLKVEDLILEFGQVTHSTLVNLSEDLVKVVQDSVNKECPVKVLRKINNRETEEVSLKITPSNWNGNGLLGCHIIKHL